MKQRTLAAIGLSLALAAVAALASSAGCNGTGVTPVCAYPDGAFDPESGCDQPVEAAVSEDSSADQGSPATSEDAGQDVTVPTVDASDSGGMDATDAEKAADADADAGEEHDAHIADAHADAKG